METTQTNKEQWTYEPPAKPVYLSFLRFFAGLQLTIAIVGILVFVVMVIIEFGRRYGEASNAWFFALVIVIQGFVAFGVLNALADIAENLILIGRQQKNNSSQKETIGE